MFILFLAIAVFQSLGTSMPISGDMDPREALQSGPVMLGNHRIRTRFDIVWSCVATLFICTWVAIHPNIPPRGEGHIRSLWRRIKLMLWTLVVPELILIWAYRQWSAARYIAEYFQDEGWTPVHGHFMIMGGFTYIEGGVESVLDFDEFRERLGIDMDDSDIDSDVDSYNSPQQQISFPTITAEEIHDKARGDFLSKAIVMLQSLWFILQCVARGKQGLALTELELVTLALASLNGVMYYFWWDKPLGVKEPIKLYRKGQEPAETIIRGERSENNRRIERIEASSKRSFVQRFVVCPFQSLRSSLSQSLEDLGSALSSCRAQLSFIHYQLSSISRSTISKFINDQRRKLDFPGHTHLWFLYLPILWFLNNPFVSFAEPLFGIATTTELKTQATHVPTFYSPVTDSDDKGNLLFFVLPPIAMAFGALHCIGWNFLFPSSVEQLLWRIGSLVITFIPLVPFVLALFVLAILFLDEKLKRRYRFSFSVSLPENVGTVLGVTLVTVAGFLAGAGLVAYMLARILLLTQAVVLMRQQPESAFYAINWAHFLPHI